MASETVSASAFNARLVTQCSSTPIQSHVYKHEQHLSELQHMLHKQWLSGSNCDLVICCDGLQETVPVHFCVMSCFSPKVSTDLSGATRKGSLQFLRAEFRLDVVKELVSFMYTGLLRVNFQDAEELLRCASQFGVAAAVNFVHLFMQADPTLQGRFVSKQETLKTEYDGMKNRELNTSGSPASLCMQPSTGTSGENSLFHFQNAAAEIGYNYIRREFFDASSTHSLFSAEENTGTVVFPGSDVYYAHLGGNDKSKGTCFSKQTEKSPENTCDNEEDVTSTDAGKPASADASSSLLTDSASQTCMVTTDKKKKNKFIAETTPSDQANTSEITPVQGRAKRKSVPWKSGTVRKADRENSATSRGSLKISSASAGRKSELTQAKGKAILQHTERKMNKKYALKGTKQKPEIQKKNTKSDEDVRNSDIVEQLQSNDCEVKSLENTVTYATHKCRVCGELFYSKALFREHFSLAHLPNACDQCPERYKLRASLKRHIQKCHRDPIVFRCAHCDSTFTVQNAFRRHCLEVHNNGKPFSCLEPGCSVKFPKLADYHNHMETVHVGARPVICKNCGKNFTKRVYFSSHQFTCVNKGQFLCQECGGVFNLKQSLQSHVRTVHRKETNYVCTDCGKRFSHPRNLWRHMLIHKNLFPHPCDLCDQKFRHSNTLRHHKERMHSIGFAGDIQMPTHLTPVSEPLLPPIAPSSPPHPQAYLPNHSWRFQP